MKLIDRIQVALVKRLYVQDEWNIPLDVKADDFASRVQLLAQVQKAWAPWTLKPLKQSPRDLIAKNQSLLMRLVTWILNLYRARQLTKLEAQRAKYFADEEVMRRKLDSQ